MLRKVLKRNTVERDPAVEQMTIQASIFLDTTSAEHIAELSRAVDNLINTLDYTIAEKDPPEQGSWFRRLRLVGDPARTDAAHAKLEAVERALELKTPASGADPDLTEAVDGLLKSLEAVPNAVIRVGSRVVVKTGDTIVARSLSPMESLTLDRHPEALRAPEEMQSLLAEWDASEH